MGATFDKLLGALLMHLHKPADISPQGAGSGLDADTLDGSHAAAFAAAADLANYLRLDASNDPVTGQLDVNNVLTGTDVQGYGGVAATMSKGMKSPYTNTVIVDAGGKGDYTTIKDACDYMATQSGKRLILVMPGTYNESAFTVPTGTTVNGWASDYSNNSVVTISPTSTLTGGTFITLAGASSILKNLIINIAAAKFGTLVSEQVIVSAAGGVFDNIQISNIIAPTQPAQRVVLLATTGTTVLTNCVFYGFSFNNVTYIRTTGSGVVTCRYSWLWGPTSAKTGTYCFDLTTGQNSIFFCRLGAATGTFFETDIYVYGSASANINNTPYKNSTTASGGTIAHIDRWYPTEAAVREAVAATDIPLILKGASSQSGDYFEVQTSTGTVIVYITSGGHVVLAQDSAALKLGAGVDMSIYYDGTSGYIDTSLVAASDLHLTTGAAKTLVLDTMVWDDLRVTPGSFDRPGISDPDIVAYNVNGGGVSTYLWEFAKNDIASFVVQMPHSYKTGENIKVHIHWTPGPNGAAENGNTVGWKIEYAWANIDGTFGTMASADLSDACDGTDHKHQMTPEATITGSGKGISSMLICNVKRTDTGADDTWAGTASGALPMLLEIDFHYPMDTVGSRQASAK